MPRVRQGAANRQLSGVKTRQGVRRVQRLHKDGKKSDLCKAECREIRGGDKAEYSDPEFDGKTPREVQDILARAAKWLNNYGGFTCEVSLRYEKEIKLDVK